jgi:hypothetical protein
MATARFKSVVEQCGVPEVYTLWVEPKKDATFQRALTQHRVMSIHQETVGTRKDYGEIGFTGGSQGQLLIFPTSLKAFVGKKVVGIQYELLANEPAAEPEEHRRASKAEAALKKQRPQKIVRFPKPELAAPQPSAGTPPAPTRQPESDRERILRGVRKAMQQLQDGKAVAAYQTLEKLASS